ncbi:MAG: polyprenyl synthetase family protein [Bacteroidales bacterium]|nr:polyprenyl synthetase family protein [Bacteroidales bacterium]
MTVLNDIALPIESHLKAFDRHFRETMKTRVPLLDKITGYIVRRKGKQMRPMFVFLSAGMCGGITESTYRAASLVELLHTATLVHDDVVDDSYERRGFFSINALWKNKIAVLVGDFLLARGLLLAVDHGEFDLLRIVSDATREMSEGELLQIEKARSLDIDEDTYYEVIRKKTASLIASCCASGSRSATADTEIIRRMHQFGEKVGMAFQIKDDLLDYSDSRITGKPNGVDIKEKKMTLPLIWFLNHLPDSDRRSTIRLIRRHSNNRRKTRDLVRRVRASGGIEYAMEKMLQYRDEAMAILDTFPSCAEREGLRQLLIFTTERKH